MPSCHHGVGRRRHSDSQTPSEEGATVTLSLESLPLDSLDQPLPLPLHGPLSPSLPVSLLLLDQPRPLPLHGPLSPPSLPVSLPLLDQPWPLSPLPLPLPFLPHHRRCCSRASRASWRASSRRSRASARRRRSASSRASSSLRASPAKLNGTNGRNISISNDTSPLSLESRSY